jgi:hypothetical protein
VGDALSQALGGEGDALGGDIIVSGRAFKKVKDFFEGILLESGNYKIKGKTGPSVAPKQSGRIFVNSLSRSELSKATDSLKHYVPNAIMPYIEISNEEYGSEI